MNLTLHWPQITYLALVFFSLGISAVIHGTEKRGKHSFWTDAIAIVLGLSLLYAGGFFGHR